MGLLRGMGAIGKTHCRSTTGPLVRSHQAARFRAPWLNVLLGALLLSAGARRLRRPQRAFAGGRYIPAATPGGAAHGAAPEGRGEPRTVRNLHRPGDYRHSEIW